MKKVLLMAVGAMALVSPLQAESLKDAVRQCGQVQNSLKRLVCYDDVVKQLERYTGLEELMAVPAPIPAGTPVTSTPQASQSQTRAAAPQNTEAPAADAADDFGMEQKRLRENIVDKIYAEVVSVGEGAYDKLIVTLDNGHVWYQTDGNSYRVDEGETVYIERGALGAFYLGKDGINRRMRVKRRQ